MTPPAQARRAHLVLSAGGVRCLSYVGALEQLHEQGWKYASVSACSAGTFVGALLCAGLTPGQMREAATSLDLPSLGGDVSLRRLRRLWTLSRWPFALYPASGIAAAFAWITKNVLSKSDLTLGDLNPPLSAAAVDVASRRILVYSSGTHPRMAVTELLEITTAVPLMYSPVLREGRELVDAGVAWETPVWLTAGLEEGLDVIVLRTATKGSDDGPYRQGGRRRRRRRWAGSWLSEVLGNGIQSRDNFLLDETPRLRCHTIQTEVGAYDFKLSKAAITNLIDAGADAIDDASERRDESARARGASSRSADADAQVEASRRYARHVTRAAATVFVSYAREDQEHIEKIRKALLRARVVADPEISVWDDSYVTPGSDWHGAIVDAIQRARVAILLVSRQFMASAYIQSTEMKLIQEGAAQGELTILWVRLDDVQVPDLLTRIQAVGRFDHPFCHLNNSEQDELIADLARNVEQVIRAENPFTSAE